MDRFAVVQDVYQWTDWQIAAALLREILGLPAVTANHQARKSHGFLADNLAGDVAERLRDACAAQGLATHVVPQRDVIPALKPLRIHKVRIADDALWVRTTDLDVNKPLAWDSLRLIAVTKTSQKEVFRHWETKWGYVAGHAPTLRVTNYTQDFPEYLAEVFALSPDGEVFGVRLLSRELNYAEALGDMTPDAVVDANARTDGFRLLLSSIAARASNLYIPPESRALLAKSAPESAATPWASLEEFDACNRWLLQQLRRERPVLR